MKKKAGSIKKKSLSKSELEQALLTNFVNLQKVLTNLSLKFEELSDNISKLLQLFEISAKSFAEKYSGEGSALGGDKALLGKLDSLLDQNKTIARGIMLMEEKIRQRNIPQSGNQITYPNIKEMRQEESGIPGMIKSKPLPKY
jgi:hypothetical protein